MSTQVVLWPNGATLEIDVPKHMAPPEGMSLPLNMRMQQRMGPKERRVKWHEYGKRKDDVLRRKGDKRRRTDK